MNKCKLILPVILSLYMIGCSNSEKTAQTDINSAKNASESINTVANKKIVQPNIKETQNTSESKAKKEDKKRNSKFKR